MTAATQMAAMIRPVSLIVFDFDGVFTDNAVYVSENGIEMVRCWRSDGLGLALLRAVGVDAMVLSTEQNPVVSTRCRKLNISCIQGVADKATRLAEIVAERGIDWRQVAYVGNDINDEACLRLAGLAIVVGDAHPSVVPLAKWKTKARGGYGAVREICDQFAALRKNLP